MNKLPLISVVVATALLTTSVAKAAIFVMIPGVVGDVVGPDGNPGWFVADSFSFGIEREMKESGEKGGTTDINIGVGELQECTITKSMDVVSTKLAQFAINGNSPGSAQICVTNERDSSSGTACALRIELEKVRVTSWSTSGDADDRPTEEVAFYYNKITLKYAINPREEVSWINTQRKRLSGITK